MGAQGGTLSPTLTAAAVVLAVAAAAGGYAWAQTTQPDRVVACQSNKMLFSADPTTEQCPAGQTRVELLTTTGKAADANLLDGRNSADFVSSRITTRRVDRSLGAGTFAAVIAECLPGERVVSGGHVVRSTGAPADTINQGGGPAKKRLGQFGDVIVLFAADGATDATGWAASVNTLNQPADLSVWALCAGP